MTDSVAVDPLSLGVPAMLMRGGTSKGLFFVADELPPDAPDRDAFLLRVMGSPDDRRSTASAAPTR